MIPATEGVKKMTDQPAENMLGTSTRLSRETLPAVFDYAIERYGSSVAMKSHYPWGYQSIAYEELGRLISFLGAGLISRGLDKGDRVALLAGNSPEWAVSYAAVTLCGAAVVPMDTQLKENEIRHLLLHCEAKFLVTSLRIFSSCIEGMHLEGVQVIVIGEGESKLGDANLGEIMALGKEKINGGEDDFFRRKAEVDPDDIAAICYTSGTTGRPKGAVLLHRNIVSNIEAIQERLPCRTDDVFLSLLPLHHTFATTCNLFTPLYSGGTIVFGRSMKPRDIREDIKLEKVTILVGVPLLFEHIAGYMRSKSNKITRMKLLFSGIIASITYRLGSLFKKTIPKNLLSSFGLGSIRFCVSGAAALRPDIERAFSKLGLPILQGYGMTEASPVIAANPLDKIKRGTVGPPLPGIEARIEGPNDEGIGEIIVKGPNVMKGYFKNPEETGTTLIEGWLYTGDLGRIDPDGYITIVGRKKSVIVTAGGKNIYPDELEAHLNKNPYILESMVLTFKDRKGNDRIGVIIVPDYDALGASERLKDKLTEDNIRMIISSEIKKICSELPEYKRIVNFQMRDEELPKTTTRKLKRHLVKWIEE